MAEDLDDDPPFDFDRWLASKDPSEQERLNLIVMKYFDLNNDIYDPIESNYHLEAIAAEYDLMQHGEDTKFIQHMNEGSVELGRVGAYDKSMEEMTVGDLDTMYGVPILYDPDDRADLEMKYTSSDIFEIAFDHIAKANEGGRPMDNQRMAPQWMQVEESPNEAENEVEITGVGMNNGDDDCCKEAKDKMAVAVASTSPTLTPEQKDELRASYGALSCEALYDLVERLGTSDNPGPYKMILDEWDSCSSQKFNGDFTASEDPFEIAWDMVIKMPIRPESLHQKRREYSYFNPKRKTKQEREKISPLMAVPIDEGDESDDDELSYEAIYDHDDGFSHTPSMIIGPEGIIAERIDTPDSSEIIAGREDKRVWGDPLSQRREWWLQGPHGDLYARRGDGKGNVAMEEGNQYRIEEGNLQGKDREKLMEYLEMLSTMMNQHGDELILDNDVRMMPNPDLERKS